MNQRQMKNKILTIRASYRFQKHSLETKTNLHSLTFKSNIAAHLEKLRNVAETIQQLEEERWK